MHGQKKLIRVSRLIRLQPFMKLIFIPLVIISSVLELNGQLTPEIIIDRSIEFHDPQNLLRSKKVTMTFKESRPSGSDRDSYVVLYPSKEYYKIERTFDGNTTTMIADGNKSTFMLNNSEDFSEEDRSNYRLTKDRLDMMSSYYRYLWHLPVTLKDPGTIIHPSYAQVDFFGKNCLEIKVTYEPEVGSDIWYFYFDPETFSLQGYRFYHDEDANDGEYILISDLVSNGDLRIPKTRKWYTHKEDKYLGSDELVTILLE